MSYAGDYRIKEGPAFTEDGIVMKPFAELIAAEEDEDEIAELKKMEKTILRITEDGKMINVMPIPEGTPQEEIDKAKAMGRVTDDNMVLLEARNNVKFEDGNIYLSDPHKMLTGDEWVKLNTDVEGELNMVMYTYQKI